jgi:adenylate cyclase
MSQEGFKRKLTSIFSADAVGYSRLMGDDESATVRTLTSYRNVISTLIKQHNGTVIDSPGDNLLAEFVSVVDAVQCAVAVQKELKTRNEELADNRKMQFRIGINLGDVIQEGDRIYGDGVNIAARLEGLAEPGGICISKTAFDHIESKLPYGYEFLGDQPVKNIAKPIGAYRVIMEPRVTVAVKTGGRKPSSLRRKAILAAVISLFVLVCGLGFWQFYRWHIPKVESASVEKMAYPLPDKPSIAVLPFNNLSGDPDQDFISDGISENIISALSKIGELFVIARNSTFVYKGRAINIQQVAEDLGVRFVLEGSVQKSGGKIRVTAQLIDAISGYHLWSERYDRQIKDFFQILDEITQKVVIALQAKLTHGEQVRRWYGTTNFEAWELIAQGWGLFESYAEEKNRMARKLFEQALEIDPNSAFAWTALSWTYFIDTRLGYSKSPGETFKKTINFAQKAIEIDDKLPEVHALWNTVYLIQRQHDKAIAEGKKSIDIGPNSALSHILFAQTMYFAGNFNYAIALAEKAIRLSPYCPPWYLGVLGLAYRQVGKYQKAIELLNQYYKRAKKEGYYNYGISAYLSATYAMAGQYNEARMYWDEALKFNPDLGLDTIKKVNFFKNPTHLEQIIEALRNAGIELK